MDVRCARYAVCRIGKQHRRQTRIRAGRGALVVAAVHGPVAVVVPAVAAILLAAAAGSVDVALVTSEGSLIEAERHARRPVEVGAVTLFTGFDHAVAADARSAVPRLSRC